MIGSPWDTGGDVPVTSVNGYQGDVVLTAGDVGADPEGAATIAVGQHLDEEDPHPQYQLRSEVGVPNGYANLDPSGFVLQDPASSTATPTANAIPKADGAGTLDAWISSSSETDPGLVQLATDAEEAANKAVSGTDSRLSNARDPNDHATRHQHGGDDEIATGTAAGNAIPKANASGHLDSGWGGAASSLATLDASTLVPTAQLGTGTANATKFLRGDRSWATALQGALGSTDNALLRADGTGGLTGQGSSATLDDSNNLTLGSRSINQPISPSAWSGSSTNHDMPIPSWATTAGKYYALVRVRVQQNATTSSFQARSHQIEMTYSGSAWSIDATSGGPSIGALPTTTGWLISGGTNLRMSLTGMGGANSGNVGLVLEQFIFYGAL